MWVLYVGCVPVTDRPFLAFVKQGINIIPSPGYTSLTGHVPGQGDVAGGALWAVALYYCSPVQLLLLFLGRFETERPSDGILRLLGLAAGLRRACMCISREGV